MRLDKIKANPSNPRVIRDDKFNKLVKSLQGFPEMMYKRPIVVDETMTVLGGNMRLRALQHIYGKGGDIPDAWVVVAEGWTEEQKREFVIKDNAAFGGSGTTMIAAEQLNRRCYMMEIDPHYCDVIIARWEKFTGRKAERVTEGMDV